MSIRCNLCLDLLIYWTIVWQLALNWILFQEFFYVTLLTGDEVPCPDQIGPSVKLARGTIASFHPQRSRLRSFGAPSMRSLLQGCRDAECEYDAGCDVKNVQSNIAFRKKNTVWIREWINAWQDLPDTKGFMMASSQERWRSNVIFGRWENRLFIRSIISNQTLDCPKNW